MVNPTIAYHAKNDLHGWYEVCRYPADWDGWHKFDQMMIGEMLRQNQTVVTCGWNMYQVIPEAQHG